MALLSDDGGKEDKTRLPFTATVRAKCGRGSDKGKGRIVFFAESRIFRATGDMCRGVKVGGAAAVRIVVAR